MSAAGPTDVLDWVERLGGWAVVLIIVRWMMSRIDTMIEGWQRALDQFARFEEHEESVHKEIVQTQRDILTELRTLKGG